MKTLHIQCAAGISGDMFVAACLNAELVTIDELGMIPDLLGLDSVEIRAEKVRRAKIVATHVSVGGGGTAVPTDQHHTHYEQLDRRLAESRLSDGAKSFARKVFQLLAEAEAAAHGRSLDRVVFHEVGTVDSLVDVAMAGFCIERIGAESVTAEPPPLGRGFVDIAHGQLAVPPPATAHLIKGLKIAPVPAAIADANIELTTPTGAAILQALQPTFVTCWPPGTPTYSGLGAGSRDIEGFANVLRIVLLEDDAPSKQLFDRDTVVEVVCNLDDQTPERTAWAAETVLQLGALDAWITPIVGKKGRPAVQLSLLVSLQDRDRFLEWLLRFTSTFGVRFREWERRKLIKRIEQRPGPDGGRVAYAVGLTLDGTPVKEKPEYEDASRFWSRPSSRHER